MADTENSLNETSGIPEIDYEVEVFGMTQAEVDKTLTIDDCAADAKAVGDRFGNVEGDISDLDAAIQAINAWTGEDIRLKPGTEQTVSAAIEAANTRMASAIQMSTEDTRNTKDAIDSVASGLSDLSGTVTDLSETVTDLSGTVTDLSGTVTELGERTASDIPYGTTSEDSIHDKIEDIVANAVIGNMTVEQVKAL